MLTRVTVCNMYCTSMDSLWMLENGDYAFYMYDDVMWLKLTLPPVRWSSTTVIGILRLTSRRWIEHTDSDRPSRSPFIGSSAKALLRNAYYRGPKKRVRWVQFRITAQSCSGFLRPEEMCRYLRCVAMIISIHHFPNWLLFWVDLFYNILYQDVRLRKTRSKVKWIFSLWV